ncbi:hypothetical protein DRQ18_02060 [bacterium]|nr:MAG: hypothetical protein DRQ18_02060 [bacterium]
MKGRIIKVQELDERDIKRMFGIFCEYFENTTLENFTRDLEKKEYVILIEEAGELHGFTTIALYHVNVDGKDVRVIYSGDTIVEREHWQELALFRTFGGFIRPLMEEDIPLYWFLISMGYRTYRLLPLFFNEFYPRYDAPTPPFERKLIRIMGEMLFPAEYDDETGVIKRRKERLKEKWRGVSERVRRDPHVRFFLEKNPYYTEGEELACIARVSRENLTRYGKRMVE